MKVKQLKEILASMPENFDGKEINLRIREDDGRVLAYSRMQKYAVEDNKGNRFIIFEGQGI